MLCLIQHLGTNLYTMDDVDLVGKVGEYGMVLAAILMAVALPWEWYKMYKSRKSRK